VCRRVEGTAGDGAADGAPMRWECLSSVDGAMDVSVPASSRATGRAGHAAGKSARGSLVGFRYLCAVEAQGVVEPPPPWLRRPPTVVTSTPTLTSWLRTVLPWPWSASFRAGSVDRQLVTQKTTQAPSVPL
jgi:hypothetical protein